MQKYIFNNDGGQIGCHPWMEPEPKVSAAGCAEFYLATEVDARIAEHDKDWEDAAKERVQHLTRIAELEKAVNRGIEALSRCYDVTEWPADRGSFQLTVLNDLKSLMVSKPDAH